jgi:hypothetical protein
MQLLECEGLMEPEMEMNIWLFSRPCYENLTAVAYRFHGLNAPFYAPLDLLL